MKRLFLKILLFLFVNLLIIIGIMEYLNLRDKRISANVSTTESVALSLYQGHHYNWLIMGSSHGRNMVRGENYFNLTSKTHRKIACIAQTAGGVIPELFWLKYFYSTLNQADTILYVIDPFVLFTPTWNEDLSFLANEPFRWDLFKLVVQSPLSNEVKFNYIKSKFQDKWLSSRGIYIQDEHGELLTVDTSAVRMRIESLYPDHLNRENYHRYAFVLVDIVKYANKKGSKVLFILPPSLLGELPGKLELITLLKNLQKNGIADYHDFSQAMLNPALYYNHDHLNSAGMDWYISNCLSLVSQSGQ